jgi:hypothetical protein
MQANPRLFSHLLTPEQLGHLFHAQPLEESDVEIDLVDRIHGTALHCADEPAPSALSEVAINRKATIALPAAPPEKKIDHSS